jgi:hypothetical protein
MVGSIFFCLEKTKTEKISEVFFSKNVLHQVCSKQNDKSERQRDERENLKDNGVKHKEAPGVLQKKC